jgi:hypothetical protein
MVDTSQRKTRFQNRGNNTQAERNRLNASIPQGNEVNANVQNIIRSEDITYSNTENFAQTDALYFSTAKDTYNEGELALQSIETKKARMSYTATFASNTYTLTAKSSTISEIIDGTFNNQEYQDKTVRLSPVALFDGFHTSFIAPATNTGSTSIAIQLYDGSFTTKTLKKYNDLGVLTTLAAGDVLLMRKYDIVIISGEAIIFGGIQQATETVAGILKISTSAQALAGADNNTAMTPAKVNAKILELFTATKATTGETKDANGFIMKWSSQASSSGNDLITQSVTFATAFPTACVGFFGTVLTAGQVGACFIDLTAISTTGATYRILERTSVAITTPTVRWFAIGY